jgi:hypothetical protein
MATDIEVITTIGAVVSKAVSPKQFQGLFDVIPFTVVLTETSIAAALSAQGDVTVTGAAMGDFVLLAPTVDATQISVSAVVSAANTLTVTFHNNDSTDAAAAFAAASTFNGILLRPKQNVLAFGT